MSHITTIYFIHPVSQKSEEWFYRSHERMNTVRRSLDGTQMILKFNPIDLLGKDENAENGRIFKRKNGYTHDQMLRYLQANKKDWESEEI